MNQIKVIANLPIKGQDCIKRIYSDKGVAPTISTMQGRQREPKVVLNNKNLKI